MLSDRNKEEDEVHLRQSLLSRSINVMNVERIGNKETGKQTRKASESAIFFYYKYNSAV